MCWRNAEESNKLVMLSNFVLFNHSKSISLMLRYKWWSFNPNQKFRFLYFFANLVDDSLFPSEEPMDNSFISPFCQELSHIWNLNSVLWMRKNFLYTILYTNFSNLTPKNFVFKKKFSITSRFQVDTWVAWYFSIPSIIKSAFIPIGSTICGTVKKVFFIITFIKPLRHMYSIYAMRVKNME